MSTLESKLSPVDDFWDQKGAEKKIVDDLNTEIRQLEGTIVLGRKMMALQSAPGWEPFVKALVDFRIYRRQELELCDGSDSDVRVLQGRVREITAVLSLMRHAERNIDRLEERLSQLQGHKESRVRPDGKVQPAGAT